ncbi:MAG: amylo-alpha-1,6-glucosidase [Myxococcales bacterium]
MPERAPVVRSMRWDGKGDLQPLLTREWLITNGLGGYASGTVAGVATRRYHGLLVAALPAPHGRTMFFNHLRETVRGQDGAQYFLGGDERRGGELLVPGAGLLQEFRLEDGLPIWRYRLGDTVFEKIVHIVHGQNTVQVSYRLVEGQGPLRLKIWPRMHFRFHDAPVSTEVGGPYQLTAIGDRYEIRGTGGLPPLRLRLVGDRKAFTLEPRVERELLYRIEESRGYEHVGDQWSPGFVRFDVDRARPASIVASTESWGEIEALSPEGALLAERGRRSRVLELAPPPLRTGPAAELVLAADGFLIVPVGRSGEAARARALGDEARRVIAGYHWFTDWGRDTMISLEGLTISTGRVREAGNILRTFAQYVRDGLIPNMFPEGQNEGVYHTADATLWFFHALGRYLRASGDRFTLQKLLPTLHEIVRRHLQGTRFGIHVDPADGLLAQGETGYQLTWMDAKYRDWVVTPRRGKAVEINALWYNALRLLEQWSREESDASGSAALAEHADRARASFNRRFWCEAKGHLYDVVDQEGGGDDAQCRPNQIFALSLDYPVLDRNRWAPVLETVQKRLLTPVGLRSLSREDKDYKPNYHGDLQTRDAAYHQGTVWSWLIGPFLDAFLRVHPEETKEARRFLDGLFDHLDEACLGNVSEVFDAEAPYAPRGCIAQAWGVAEVLRSYLRISNPGA